MAITNLTNTTWYIQANVPPETFNDAIRGTVSYNGSSYSFKLCAVQSDGVVAFDNYGADDGFYVPAGSYYTVTFDTNPSETYFHYYVEQNGTQLKVTDLTDTTWVLNSNVSQIEGATIGYPSFGLDFISNGQEFITLHFVYWFYEKEGFGENYIAYNGTQIFSSASNQTQLSLSNSSAYLTINITGGKDVENPNLISWLETNGELQKPNPSLTYDLSQLDLPEGTHSITVVAKADGYSNSAPSNAVEYVVEPSLPVWNGTDLTGTTWVLGSGFETKGYNKTYHVSGTVTGTLKSQFNNEVFEGTRGFDFFGISYNSQTIPDILFSNYKFTTNPTRHYYKNNVSTPIIITITGPDPYEYENNMYSDLSNVVLIEWLIKYATLTSHTMA